MGQRRVGRLDPGGAGVSRRSAGGAGSKDGNAIATGAVARESWPLLTSRPPERRGPAQLLQLFRQHWSTESSLHQVKDRSWDEDRHTLRHPGLGAVFAALVNVSLNVLRRRVASGADVPAFARRDLRLPPKTDYRLPDWTSTLTLQSSCMR